MHLSYCTCSFKVLPAKVNLLHNFIFQGRFCILSYNLVISSVCSLDMPVFFLPNRR
ncbi:hypothetical protein CLOL250_01463 [Clostridium sp. L2-50]|nr:hypothetical protein CLOL250_01463 [Clostridium sp. L2-50]